MNIQIFGRSKSFDTRKAERYFKERGIRFQSVDIDRYGMSKGELESVGRAVGLDALIDTDCRAFKELGMQYIDGPGMREDILLNHPKVMITPVVRNGKLATVGFKPEVWKTWE